MPRRKQRSHLDGLSLGFLEMHPADAADELERQTTTDAVAILTAVPVRIAAAVVAEMLPLQAAHCLLSCSEELRSALLHSQPVQIIAALLRHFNQEQRARALTQLPSATAMTCRLLLRHPENSVGSIVDGNAMAIVPTLTVKEVLAKVRQEQHGNTDYINVINTQGCIVGVVALADLLRSNQQHTLEAIVQKNVPHLSVQATLAAAYAHPGWGDYHVLPVVEREQRYVGALRYADLHHQIQKQKLMQALPENPHMSLEVVGAGYWQMFETLLQGVVTVLPPARRKQANKKS